MSGLLLLMIAATAAVAAASTDVTPGRPFSGQDMQGSRPNGAPVRTMSPLLPAPKLGATGDINVGGRRFRLIANEKTWNNAQAHCEGLGGNLATTDTKDIGDTLVEAYRQAGLPAGATGGFWIGLRTKDGAFTTCPWEYTWMSTGKPQNLDVYYCWRTVKAGGRKLLGTPAGTGGCVNMKRYDPAPHHWVYGAGLWVGWPCDSTMAAFFCEL